MDVPVLIAARRGRAQDLLATEREPEIKLALAAAIVRALAETTLAGNDAALKKPLDET